MQKARLNYQDARYDWVVLVQDRKRDVSNHWSIGFFKPGTDGCVFKTYNGLPQSTGEYAGLDCDGNATPTTAPQPLLMKGNEL